MFVIFTRLFLRLIVLISVISSIFFFYVFGYKYDVQRGFVKSSGVYDIKYFSDDNFDKTITINSKKYYIVDNKLTLYGLEDTTCGVMKIGNYKKYDCYDGEKYSNIVYIPGSSVKIHTITKNTIFSKLNLKDNKDFSVKYDFNWKGIKFSYYDDGTLVYQDDISSKKLLNIKGASFVGYNSDGLFFYKDNKLYFLEILANL